MICVLCGAITSWNVKPCLAVPTVSSMNRPDPILLFAIQRRKCRPNDASNHLGKSPTNFYIDFSFWCFISLLKMKLMTLFEIYWSRVLEFSSGTVCGPERVASRDCYQHTSCSECLGEWPIYRGVPQACQWCTNCKAGRCIPYGHDCQEENRCEVKQRDTTDASQCHERSCPASDCEKCRDLGRCMWTRQVINWTTELRRWNQTMNL